MVESVSTAICGKTVNTTLAEDPHISESILENFVRAEGLEPTLLRTGT